MTYIPGTDTPNDLQNTKDQKTEQEPSNKITVLNVPEMKRVKKEGVHPEDELWYNKFNTWVLTGTAISAIFALLTFLNIKFIYFIPFGPVAGALSWHIRKIARRYDEKTNKFFRQT